MTDDVQGDAPEMSRSQVEKSMGEHAQELYRSWADEHGLVNDLIGSAEDIGERPVEPEDTLALACSAAIASTALEKALAQEWSLYSPQDGAVVAAALQDQLRATASNLHRLKAAVQRIAAREEMQLPPESGLVEPEDENVADAVDRLSTVADEIEQHVGSLGPAVMVLDEASTLFEPAVNSHGNLRAVVRLVGGTVKIVGDGPAEEHLGERCGCTAIIERSADTYYLTYEELGWELLRDRDGVEHSDGTKSWTNRIDLNVMSAVAHPQHIADQVTRAVGEA